VEDWKTEGSLYTAPQSVGPSEHAQIQVRIDEWAESLAVRFLRLSHGVEQSLRLTSECCLQSSAYDLEALKSLDRPLRPFFVSPASTLSHHPASEFTTCYPIICASASKLAEEADGMERERGFTYVQGSGDE